MRTVWSFLRRYGWFVLFAVGAVLAAVGAIIARRRRPPGTPPIGTAISAELAAIRAEGAAEALVAHLGRDAALGHAQREYEAQKAALKEQEREEAKKLMDDPVALSAFLVRAGRLRR